MTPRRLCIVAMLAAAIALALTTAASATTPHDDPDNPDAANLDAPPLLPIVVLPGRARSLLTPNAGATAVCASGAHTLSQFGDRVYPDVGNGGYTSLHTDVHIDYDALTNMFLPGTHVDLTLRSTQCLSDLSFDFERTNANGAGPNMTVGSVLIDGAAVTSFEFKQPTYPGDPNGQDDPDPLAHQASNANPVSATNPNPPACSPQTSGNSQNGTQCPANKLVVTPTTPIPEGTTFTVTINYTGRPGVHVDGDGSTEGWFRVNTAAAPNDGSFVTTEPVGTMAWMPLNNHPSAKPTYDFFDTTNIGKTAIANGEIVGFTPPTGGVAAQVAVPPTSVNPPDANFAGGSWTWHWHSPEPIASYLVENSIASYDLAAYTSATSGIEYYFAQGSAITATRKALNKIAMDNLEDIVEFQRQFGGDYPFTTAGVVVGIPAASFEEEMQGKITFAGGTIGGGTGTSLGTLNHESMHQWFGDNVAESAFRLTFWKEGFARLGEYLNSARAAATAAGGSGTPAGDAAFETSLVNQFNTTYAGGGNNWVVAPSNPTVGNLFTTANTYNRPAASYLALWRTLGRDRMIDAMQDIQGTFGDGSVRELELEDVFRSWLPVPSASCNERLDQFFPQWWDTAFPAGGGTNKPAITGPGLNGTGFVCAQVSPADPDGSNRWYVSPPTVTWQGFGTPAVTKDGCVDGAVTDEGSTTRSCSVTTTAAPILTSGAVSETVQLDTVKPSTAATLTPTAVGAWYSPRSVTLTPADATSGVDSTSYRVDGGPWTTYSVPFEITSFGPQTLDWYSTDVAGNVEATQTTSWGNDPPATQIAGLSAFLAGLGLDKGLTKDLQNFLDEANKKLAKPKAACNQLDGFVRRVDEQAGKKAPRLTAEQGQQLLSVYQIETAIGCIPVGSPIPGAAHDLLALLPTIDAFGLDKPVADDLSNRVSDAAKALTGPDTKATCKQLGDLTQKIADLKSKGKLTAGQAATLTTEVAAIATDLGC